MTLRVFIASLLALALAACGSPTSKLASLPASTAASQTTYKLGAGDKIRIVVGGFTTMSNTYNIGDTGSISLPLLGAISVAGKSTGEVEQGIAQSLVKEQLAVNPTVSVQVEEYRPFFILGEVKKPGAFPYVPGMTVLTAISIAGGHTFRADTKNYGINRIENGVTVKGKGTQDTQIQPGDTIIVYESWF